ncbi:MULTISPECIES: hypothetical protein [Streptomyces]|uniref:Esterase n=1 Tax=Streptomyces doebereineriae TaxID=3075528 RepID=A0ABU2VGG1_9ACTN|nr:hypothetical protein [Streptomyces sp. DSM 41640]MDT0484670.1 hypothetical protein [Streptomyces sp. DSM 41640]
MAQAEADDGFVLRGWLVLPEGASAERPAPLLVVTYAASLSIFV